MIGPPPGLTGAAFEAIGAAFTAMGAMCFPVAQGAVTVGLVFGLALEIWAFFPVSRALTSDFFFIASSLLQSRSKRVPKNCARQPSKKNLVTDRPPPDVSLLLP
jgi:hypothetical protein